MPGALAEPESVRLVLADPNDSAVQEEEPANLALAEYGESCSASVFHATDQSASVKQLDVSPAGRVAVECSSALARPSTASGSSAAKAVVAQRPAQQISPPGHKIVGSRQEDLPAVLPAECSWRAFQVLSRAGPSGGSRVCDPLGDAIVREPTEPSTGRVRTPAADGHVATVSERGMRDALESSGRPLERPQSSATAPDEVRTGCSNPRTAGRGSEVGGASRSAWRRKMTALLRRWQGEPGATRFADFCCGQGGATLAGIMAKWVPILGVDFCVSIKKWFTQNFDHEFMCADLHDAAVRDLIVARFRGLLDACLLSPPCQPYSTANSRKVDAKDRRVQLFLEILEMVLRLRPQVFIVECVASMLNCKHIPIWKDVVLPAAVAAGYSVSANVYNLSQCKVPHSRTRVFAVFTLYARTGRLERAMVVVRRRKPMPLSAWFPTPRYRSVKPCRSSPATFDATLKPCPCALTSCVVEPSAELYKRKASDVCELDEATPITVDERRRLNCLPEWFVLPAKGDKCDGERCCGRATRCLLGVALGNMVVPQQALVSYKNCEVECNLRRVKSKLSAASAPYSPPGIVPAARPASAVASGELRAEQRDAADDVAGAVRRYVAASSASAAAAIAAEVYAMDTVSVFPHRHVFTSGYPLPGLGLPPALTPKMEQVRRDVVVADAACERVEMEKAAHRAAHIRERLGLAAE